MATEQCPECGAKIEIRIESEESMADRLLQRMADKRTYQAAATMSPAVVVDDKPPDLVRVRGEWKQPRRDTSTETRRPGSVTTDTISRPIAATSVRGQVAPALAAAVTTWLGLGSLLFPPLLGVSDFLARHDWTPIGIELFHTGIPKPGLVSFWVSGAVGAIVFMLNFDFFKDAIFEERKFIEQIEQATGLDLNRDGHVGAPDQELVRPFPVTPPKRKSQTIRYYELPNGRQVREDKLHRFLEDAVERDEWSREYWCNKPSDANRPGIEYLTQTQWAGIKELCEQFDVWRVGDRDYIHDLVESLKDELDTRSPAPFNAR